MKPITIIRHTQTEGPGYFATFLEQHSLPWKLLAIDQGDALPARADGLSGIALMGGPMSVNDALPWIADECALIRDAVARDVPVIGHCLGGQLISKSLGGRVTPNPCKEIGWGQVRVEGSDAIVRRWLGDLVAATATDVFQWHGETFSVPDGAQRILTNDFCANQAFVLGPHLALQCHVEMTRSMIAEWCRSWSDEVAGLDPLPPTVQTPEQMLAQTATRLPAMRALADQLYSVWIGGIENS